MMPPLNKFTRFDVRDRLRQRIEPFPKILARVNALAAGGRVDCPGALPALAADRTAGQ